MNVKKIGIDFYVVCCPSGPFTRGETGNQFRSLLQMEEARYDDLLNLRDRMALKIKSLTEAANIKFLDIDMDCLNGLGYREVLAHPLDWHHSAEANKRIGEEVAEKLMAAMKLQ